MNKICPICGQKNKIICRSYRSTKYSIYRRHSIYVCSVCNGKMKNNKSKPNLVEHIIVWCIALILSLIMLFICNDYLITLIAFVVYIVLSYYVLGLKDLYYVKKLIPVDENGNPLILKPNLVVNFENMRMENLEPNEVIVCKDYSIVLFCVNYDKKSNVAMCYCISGNYKKVMNLNVALYINDKLVSTNSQIKQIE